MPPAVECDICHFRVKTRQAADATEVEMGRLIGEIAVHYVEHSPKDTNGHHIKFHKITPSSGDFIFCKIV